MADYSMKAEITGDSSGYVSAVEKAKKASKNLSSTVSDVVKGLGKNGFVGALGAVGLASAGLSATLGTVAKVAKKVSQTINDCTTAYKQQLVAERQLSTAIKNNPLVTGDSENALKKFASEMQKVTNYGDEQLIPMMANLVSLGRTEEETMNIMAVALDMSASGAMSLDTAITQLNATMNGNIGRLGQQNAELKGLTEEELKNGKAVEILGKKYKGMATSTVDTAKQLKNAVGDLKEAYGQTFEKALTPMRKYFTEIIQGWADAKKAKQEYEQSSEAVEAGKNTLAQLQSVIDERTRDFEELKRQLEELKETTEDWDWLGKEAIQIKQQEVKEAERELGILNARYNNQKRQEELASQQLKEEQDRVSTEKQIIDLKQKYLDKISEQEAKWKNIYKVTGEQAKNEEKLTFYQEQLVAIMTESGGLITENNQYYKDQKKIIDELIKLIQEEGGAVVDIEEEINDKTEENTNQIKTFSEQLKDFFDETEKKAFDWGETFSTVYNSMQNALEDTFTQIGKSLVEGSNGWQSYASIAVGAIAEVISALGKQLAVMATAKAVAKDYGGATKALAGATLAFTTSGVLSAVASKLDSTQKTIKSIGDAANQSGKDLEYFKKRLEEITSGQTTSSRNLLGNLTTLSGELTVLKERANEALKAVEAFPQNKKYVSTSASTYMETKAWKEVQENYESVRKEVEKYENTISSAIPNIINTLKQEVSANNVLKKSYDEIYNSYWKYQSAYSTYMNTSSFFVARKQSAKYLMQSYEQELQLLIAEQKESLQKMFVVVYENLSNTGKTIGEKLINSIVNGAEKTDFLKDMKSYIRENLIKLVVYTESFQDKLAEVGMTLARALTEGVSVYGVLDLSKVKKELEDLYETASTNAKAVESILDGVFGNFDKNIDNISDGLDGLEDKLSTFEEAMLSFNETVSDLGGDLADNLIDGITNGLNEGDFLSNMKDWIRKMLIQSVVYTETMKSEIEAIGQSITKALSEGFTETNFHEIRRDLSWTFNEANKTISGIDEILNSVFGGYATGTNNATSGLHLVGEAGPELVRFRGGEQVLNTGNTQKALEGMVGTTINQNVTFNNLQDTTAYAMMNQFKQYNRQMAINVVI